MNNLNHLWRYAAAVALLCLIGYVPAARAQNGKAETSKEINLAAAHAERKAAVNDNMHLTAEEAKKFWPVYDQYEKQMDQIEARHIKEVHDYAKHYATLTDADAKAKLDEVISIQQGILDTQKEYIPKFRAVLPDIKVTRFFQIDNKLRALVQCDLAQSIPLAHSGAEH